MYVRPDNVEHAQGIKGVGFVGNISGHDFVFIVPLKHAERICITLISNFNIIVFDPFGEEKKQEGTMPRWFGEE